MAQSCVVHEGKAFESRRRGLSAAISSMNLLRSSWLSSFAKRATLETRATSMRSLMAPAPSRGANLGKASGLCGSTPSLCFGFHSVAQYPVRTPLHPRCGVLRSIGHSLSSSQGTHVRSGLQQRCISPREVGAMPAAELSKLALPSMSCARRSQPRGADSRFFRPTAKEPAEENEKKSASLSRCRPLLSCSY